MKTNLSTLATIVFACLIAACASYKPQYSKEATNWEQDTVKSPRPASHIMYLVGDAGDDIPGKPSPVLQYLKSHLGKETENSSILFLGDNIYEYGMPPKEDSLKRVDAEYRINEQLEVLDDFKGRPVFIPGNHDWRGWGVNGLEREEKYIQQYLNNRKGKTDKDDWKDYFLPKDGCSMAEAVELSDQVVLIVVDSEWWLHNWDKEPEMNADCEIKNRANFQFVFENVLRKYRNKQVVVAMHHPLYTYGSHGGNFTPRQHFFPLTDLNKNLYIPLPVIGTLGVIYRSAIGSRQDVANQQYKELRRGMLAAAAKNGSFIFAAGHEHALQHIERAGQSFVGSGSGSKNTPVKLGKGSKFGSGGNGYSTISFYDDGEMLVQYWEVDKSGDSATLVFQKKLLKRTPLNAAAIPNDFTEYQQHKDTAIETIIKEEVHPIGGLHKFLLGEHHRNLYLEKYPFPVLDLETFKGGVTPTKLGGGNQTNSLRVEDSTGRDYVFRALDKDVSRFLPFPFNRMTAAKYLVKDNFLSTHPFAPLAVAPLAEAINVYHTNPVLYYIPKQPRLGIYNPLFGNAMSLVEERPSGKKWADADYFGSPEKLIGTFDVLENLRENNKHTVDQEWVLRTRFLDFLVGDWDRHDDQWAWASIKLPGDSSVYRPIPRDRDQAFSKYDGLATGLTRFTMPFLRQLQVYGPRIYSYKWNTWSARLFDRSFLNELTWPQWEEQVKYVQQHMTDSAIENAFNSWPQRARELSAPSIINTIKARRDNLMNIAKIHYAFMNKEANVVGTDEKDRFVVDRLDDDHTRVTVYEIPKNDEALKIHFQRVFDNNITRTINLYGTGSGDEFIVNGQVDKGIKIRLIGGQGKDLFVDSSEVKKGSRKTLVYDDLRTNTVIPGNETKDLRTDAYRYNVYDRRDYSSEYNILLPLPVIGANPDDGFFLGANFSLIRYGFKKEPFKSMQTFGGSFAFATKAFSLHYTGDFINALGKLDYYFEGHYRGPSYAFNFAGIGNDTKRPVDNPNFYRVRQSEWFLYPALKKRLGLNGFASLGPFLQVADIEATAGRYLADSLNGTKTEIFNTKYYSGARLLFDFNSVDNLISPHNGIKFNTSFNYTESLKSDISFSAWRAQFSFYKALDRNENLVFASQVGTGINIGGGYEFFQMPSIGGDRGLRGFRTERFYGKSSFWHSTDLRIRFGSSYNEALPFTIGMFGGFDYGRVWQKKVNSDTWHYDYGGGLWFAPVDLLTLSFGAFVPGDKGEETPRFVLKMGFAF